MEGRIRACQLFGVDDRNVRCDALLIEIFGVMLREVWRVRPGRELGQDFVRAIKMDASVDNEFTSCHVINASVICLVIVRMGRDGRCSVELGIAT